MGGYSEYGGKLSSEVSDYDSAINRWSVIVANTSIKTPNDVILIATKIVYYIFSFPFKNNTLWNSFEAHMSLELYTINNDIYIVT